MTNPLESQLSGYQAWREQLVALIGQYRAWRERMGETDEMQDLRLYDLAQAVRRDQLMVAFVAEFARGKTETINALFFSEFKQRLLPCESGRTTMCPTELFWDAEEHPYIKLLPIETRLQDEGLAALKQNPDEWSKIRLDPGAQDAVRTQMQALAQKKTVPLDYARQLGLWDESTRSVSPARDGMVEIPVWRHALINYPHPLLQSGLVILDTPGLNALGVEPELTVSIIPNAHVVMFLLAADTGVTQSDMEIWNRLIRGRRGRKLAILNKIDLLWDALKSESELNGIIQSQLDATARHLRLSTEDVFAISAKMALLARINQDDPLLLRSGIAQVERVLARELVACKQEILRGTVIQQVATMVRESRKVAQMRLGGLRSQLDELQQLRGKNRDVVNRLIAEAGEKRKAHEQTARAFSQGQQKIQALGNALMAQLSLDQLDQMLIDSHREMDERWTTPGLNRAMKALIREMLAMSERISQQGWAIKQLGDELYRLLHSAYGLEQRTSPALNMAPLQQGLLALEKATEAFCADPINLMTEKHFLVRKFFFTLAAQARARFQETRDSARTWLKNLLIPLTRQISEHKASLDRRTEAVMKVHQNLETLQKRIQELEQQSAVLRTDAAALDQLLLQLIKTPQPSAENPPSVKPMAA